MNPIETVHNGRRYRSRTEARWAVALETAGVPFDYEREGYALAAGWYLPDFWLPAGLPGDAHPCWIEVKGVEPSGLELQLAVQLSAATGADVILAVGNPDGSKADWQMANASGAQWSRSIHLPRLAWEAATLARFDGRPPVRPKQEPMRRFW